MSVLKQYNESTSEWEAVVIGKQGPSGTVAVTSPLTNTGTSTAAVLGVDYSALQYGQNAIINGAFEINQRNFSTSTSPGYGVDRWYNQTDTTGSGSATYSLQAFTAGSAPSAGHEAANFLRCVTSGQSAAGVYTLFQQSIENVRTFAGQTVTISFWAKAASGAPKIAVLLSQDFGTGGSPSSSVETNTGKVTLSTSWARHSITTTLPNLAGKTIGTNPNTSALTLLLWLSAGSNYDGRSGSLGVQNNTFDIWGVQVETGSVATPFKRSSATIQGELAACQRYYWRASRSGAYSAIGGNGFTYSTTSGYVQITPPVPLRTTPSSVDFSNIRIADQSNSAFNITAVSLLEGTDANLATTTLGVTLSGATSGRYFYIQSSGGAGYLGLSAEF